MTKEYEYGHPFNYANKPVAKYVDIFCELASFLPRGLAVTDLFGGVGTLAKALQPILEPRRWTAVELDFDCVDKFRKDIPWATCEWGNAFDVHPTQFEDLVVIDPHKGTLNAMNKEATWSGLLFNIATSNARYILMQEYGAYWCHLPNQKILYEKLCGEVVNRDNYRKHFSKYMWDNYGFYTMESRIGLGSCYYLMEIKR